MRKESIGRLLLSLLTAFVMVAGVFGAALYTSSFTWSQETAPEPESIAACETDDGMSVIGDAPISARDDRVPDKTIHTFTKPDQLDNTEINGAFIASKEQLNELEFPVEVHEAPLRTLENEIPLKTTERTESTTEERGTRSPDEIDAKGPYGDRDDPYYEGEPIIFEAEMIEGDPDIYEFNWDFDNDGVLDSGWLPYPATITHTYCDDHIGEARLAAWDGISMDDLHVYGKPLNEEDDGWIGGAASTELIVGYRFTPLIECEIVSLGRLHTTDDDIIQVHTIALWEETNPSGTTGVLLQQVGPNQNYGWVWQSITPTTVYPGTYYRVALSMEMYAYGAMRDRTNPGSADGVINVDETVYKFDALDEYPDSPDGGGNPSVVPCVDVEWHYVVPNAIPLLIEDTAKVFVWNVEPTITEMTAGPSTLYEGEEAEFGGMFIDPGQCDDWEYMWDYGNGIQSEWMPVPKGSGGLQLLILHSNHFPGQWDFTDFVDQLTTELGDEAQAVDLYDWGWGGTDTAPPLELLQQYNVVLATGFGTGGAAHQTTGDVLADYCDGGGAVVQMSNSFGMVGSPNYGIEGRWRDEDYQVFQTATGVDDNLGMGFYLDTWDTTHPIMARVTWHWSLLCQLVPGLTPYATALGYYDNGYLHSAYTEAGHHGNPYSGRIVGLNFYSYDYAYLWDYNEGDFIYMIADALKWAGDYEPYVPYDSSVGVPLPPHHYVYPDDHPEHITPQDDVYPTLYVRDDDHCNDIWLDPPVLYDENFEVWGPYGDSPPAGWTILDLGGKLLWEWGAPTAGPTSAYSGTNCWGTNLAGDYHNNVNDWVMSQPIDLSAYTGATLDFYMWYEIETGWDYLYVEKSTDGIAWTTIDTFTGMSPSWLPYSYNVHDLAGDDEVFIRFRLDSDGSVTEAGAYIDDFSMTGWSGGVLPVPGELIDEDFSAWYPPGWYVDYGWEQSFTNYAGGSSPEALFPWWSGTYLADLESPSVDSSTEPLLNLEFKSYIQDFLGYIYLDYSCYVLVRADSGDPWSDVTPWSNPISGNVYAATYTINIDSYIGPATQVMFEFEGESWDIDYWYVDDVKIIGEGDPGDPGTKEPMPFKFHDFELDYGDFVAGPPVPWDYNDWHRYYYSGYRARVYNSGSDPETMDEWLISPVFDCTSGGYVAHGGITLSFYTRTYSLASSANCEVLYSLDGGPWTYLDDFNYPPSSTTGTFTYDMALAEGHTIQFAFHHTAPTDYEYWFIDDFSFYAVPEQRHVWGWAEMTATSPIHVTNVEPSVLIPDTLVDVGPEPATFNLEGFRITDPALEVDTEGFFYRWVYDDVPLIPWSSGAIPMSFMDEDMSAPAGWMTDDWYLFWSNNAGGDPPEAGLLWYYIYGDYAILYSPPFDTTATPVTLSLEFKSMIDNFAGGYDCRILTRANSADPWTDHTPWSNPIYGNVGPDTYVVDITDDIGTGTQVMFEFEGYYYNLDYWWVDDVKFYAPSMKDYIAPMEMSFGDNGIYTLDLQVIDDDMGWDFSSGYPEELPGATMSHSYVDLEVLNVDPEISTRLSAEIKFDISIRVTGEPDNPTTMTLLKNGVPDPDNDPNSVVISHDGNHQIAVLPVTLDMGAINDYSVEVSYVGSGGGANPTWVFQGRFADGKIKELKRVFKDGMDPWTIGPEYLKQMIVGQDITFKASASDVGSDDLAFVWNFGDSAPHGINVYANLAPTVPVAGVSCPEPDLFNVLPNRDPAFDRIPNTIKSPSGSGIQVDDTITHAFNGQYFYYVTLTVVDDDAAEDPPYLPNEQLGLIDGTDCQYMTIDLA